MQTLQWMMDCSREQRNGDGAAAITAVARAVGEQRAKYNLMSKVTIKFNVAFYKNCLFIKRRFANNS